MPSTTTNSAPGGKVSFQIRRTQQIQAEKEKYNAQAITGSQYLSIFKIFMVEVLFTIIYFTRFYNQIYSC